MIRLIVSETGIWFGAGLRRPAWSRHVNRQWLADQLEKEALARLGAGVTDPSPRPAISTPGLGGGRVEAPEVPPPDAPPAPSGPGFGGPEVDVRCPGCGELFPQPEIEPHIETGHPGIRP